MLNSNLGSRSENTKFITDHHGQSENLLYLQRSFAEQHLLNRTHERLSGL